MRLYTHSGERCYSDCQRKWHWRYGEGWVLRDAPEALRVGTSWHGLLQAVWEGSPVPEVDAADDFERARLAAMLDAYVEHWADPGVQFDVLAVEIEFDCPLWDGELREVEGWRLAGKLDAIVRDNADQDYNVEHKTCGEDISPGADYWTRLGLDAQLSIYTIGARALGFAPVGTIYDVVRKPGLRPKKATKKAEAETPAVYGARVLADMKERPDFYFARHTVARLDSQLREHCGTMAAFARQMDTAARSPADAPQNTAACHRFGRCMFWDVCSTGGHPSDHLDRLEKRENPHGELSGVQSKEATANEHHDCPL